MNEVKLKGLRVGMGNNLGLAEKVEIGWPASPLFRSYILKLRFPSKKRLAETGKANGVFPTRRVTLR